MRIMMFLPDGGGGSSVTTVLRSPGLSVSAKLGSAKGMNAAPDTKWSTKVQRRFSCPMEAENRRGRTWEVRRSPPWAPSYN